MTHSRKLILVDRSLDLEDPLAVELPRDAPGSAMVHRFLPKRCLISALVRFRLSVKSRR